MKTLDNAPETDKELRTLFSEEMDRVTLLSQNGKSPLLKSDTSDATSISAEEYKKQCAVLPGKTFNGIDMEHLLPVDFKSLYPSGSACCVALLPFNDGCFNKDEMLMEGKWDSFISDKKFLRLFSVNQRTGLTSGFGGHSAPAGLYFEMLPELLRKDISEGGCSFTVEYRNPADPHDKSDRRHFVTNCNIALNNLKLFLGRGAFLRAL